MEWMNGRMVELWNGGMMKRWNGEMAGGTMKWGNDEMGE